MFYFLVFHTSISASKTIDKKILTTFLYGSVLYLILHGLIKTSKYPIFKHLADYFWYCVIIDIATLIYLTWGIIDYPGIFERFIDTSAYSGLECNNDISYEKTDNKEGELVLSSKMDINSINDYINNVKLKGGRSMSEDVDLNNVDKRVNINECANDVCSFNGNDAPNSIMKSQPKITTARDMGLEQSTSLEELGLSDIEDLSVNNNPVETGIALPDGTQDFFAETIDISDHVSNISDIEDIDLDDFANNLQ